MAHEVETMFSAREVPWHGLGNVTDDVLTAKEAIVAAGLDWEVALHSLYAQIGKTKVKIPDRFAVVRQTDEKVFGTVSKRYVPFQNAEAFEFADNLVDSGEAKYETAGSLRGGKVVFLTMKVPTQMMVAGEDAHDLYIMLRTSHDGSKAIGVYITPIRVVCMNTLTWGIGAARNKWSFPHVSTAAGKLQEARDTLQLTHKFTESFMAQGEQLINTSVTDEDLRHLLETVLPQRPKTEEVILSIEQLYHESPTNPYTGTAWGAINAITEYFDHGRETRSQEAVLTNILDGEVAAIRQRAVGALLAV